MVSDWDQASTINLHSNLLPLRKLALLKIGRYHIARIRRNFFFFFCYPMLKIEETEDVNWFWLRLFIDLKVWMYAFEFDRFLVAKFIMNTQPLRGLFLPY